MKGASSYEVFLLIRSREVPTFGKVAIDKHVPTIRKVAIDKHVPAIGW